MRSRLSKIIFVIIALAMIFALASCTTDAPTIIEEKVTVASIAVDNSTVPKAVFAGELDVTQIRIIATMSDGTKEMISVTPAMVALESRTLLDSAGTKTVKLIYESCEARFQIVLLNKDKNQYTLRIYNGVPIKIDGISLDEEVVLDGEFFTAVYDEGTIVTVEWVAVSGFYFDYWTDNDKKVDTQSITQVTMDANHTYKAYSEAVINTISFVTNSDTGIGVRRTNFLNQGDIPALTKAGYVFDGWTTTRTEGDAAIDNTTATKITFPYNVNVETTLYGLWRVLGIGYESNPSISPTGVNGYKVLSYARNDTEVSIPDKHNNLPIISIGAEAFENASMLRKLTIPASVEVVEDGSFKNCSQLSEILIRGTSRTYSSIGGILFNYDGTELIAYPANKIAAKYAVGVGVDTIKPYAFYNNLIGGIILPSTIRKIGNNAFNSVHIDYIDFSSVNPNAVNFSLGESLFNANINTICVDASYRNTYMEYSQISNFENRVSTDVNDLSVIETNSDKSLLYREIYNENARTPATTSEIIGANRTLTTIRIPVNLHYAVSSIGVEAFNDCILLATVEIPLSSRLERVQDRAFNDTIWVKTLNKKSIIANNILYKYLGTDAVYELGDKITEIAEGAFSNNTSLQKINLTYNSDLAYIGAYAFYGCTNFVGDTLALGGGITLKKNLIGISSYAFAHTKLTKFALSAGSRLKYVGDNAFLDCYYLQSASFGAETDEIATNAFNHCFSLVSFSVQYTTDSVFQAFDGVLYKYDKAYDTAGKPSTIYLYPAGRLDTEFDINNPTGGEDLSVSIISENAFSYSNIAALYIPSSVKNINANAINIPGLIYVKFQVMGATITYNGMFGDYKPEYVLVEDISGGDSQTNILNYFNNDQNSRNENYKLASIDELSFFAEVDSPVMVYAKRDGALRLARADRSLSTINIPLTATENLGVSTIGEYAFFGFCLEEVHFGGSESIISPYAFVGAINMYKLYTVEGVTTVPTITANSFSYKFDNGLMIYVSYEGGIKQNYQTLWNLSSDKYLINLSTGLAVAKFSGIEIGVISDIAGTINEANVPKPIRAGYQFAGWLDDSNKVIDVTGDGYTIPYNITLTCKWEAKVYEIIFAIEHNASMEQTTYYVTYDEAYIFPEASLANMTLSKWRTATNTEYPSEGNWTYALIDDSITLYPVWVDKVYKLVFEEDANLTVEGEYKNVLFGQPYTIPVPSKEGLIFVGWYLKTIVGGQTKQEMLTDELGSSYLRWSIESSESNPVYTIYPAWQNKTVTVRLYLQYTSAEDNVLFATKQVPYGQPFTFVFADFYHEETDTTYTQDRFCGWYNAYDALENSGMGKRYADENGIGLFDWDVGVDCNLYAQWPIEISDGEVLTALTGEDLTKSYILTNDITILRPIGDKNNPYNGVFNGNGFTVTFNYTDKSSYDGYVGMFAHNQGTIKNVKVISNISVDCDDRDALYIGGLVGYNTGRIYSTATSGYDVTASIATKFIMYSGVGSYNINIGGLVGYNSGTISAGLRVNSLSVLAFDTVENAYVTYQGTNYNIGNTVGTLDGGTLDGTGRSSVYYYTNDNDRLKNVVCGKLIEGTIIAFSPSASKIP